MEDRVPDARTIWLFREKLTTAGAIKRLFEQFDAMLRQAGYIAMSRQIVDASPIRTMSRSIAVSASSADGRPQMRLPEGRRLRQGLLDKTNTASGVWADTAYR